MCNTSSSDDPPAGGPPRNPNRHGTPCRPSTSTPSTSLTFLEGGSIKMARLFSSVAFILLRHRVIRRRCVTAAALRPGPCDFLPAGGSRKVCPRGGRPRITRSPPPPRGLERGTIPENSLIWRPDADSRSRGLDASRRLSHLHAATLPCPLGTGPDGGALRPPDVVLSSSRSPCNTAHRTSGSDEVRASLGRSPPSGRPASFPRKT